MTDSVQVTGVRRVSYMVGGSFVEGFSDGPHQLSLEVLLAPRYTLCCKVSHVAYAYSLTTGDY